MSKAMNTIKYLDFTRIFDGEMKKGFVLVGIESAQQRCLPPGLTSSGLSDHVTRRASHATGTKLSQMTLSTTLTCV